LLKALYTGTDLLPDSVGRRSGVNGLLMLRIDASLLLENIQIKDYAEITVTAKPDGDDINPIKLIYHQGVNSEDDSEWIIGWNDSLDDIKHSSGNIVIKMREPVHWEDSENEAVITSLVLGILFTVMLIMGASILASRTRKLQDTNREITLLVNERTEELSQEKDTLEHEVKIRQQGELRLIKQQEFMLKLSTNQVSGYGEFENALRQITEISAEALDVGRVGIWFFNKNHDQLNCADLYDYIANSHLNGLLLNSSQLPNYFNAIAKGQVINSDVALKDSRTSEYATFYIESFKIRSILAAPVRREGKVEGVICFEQLNNQRNWRLDEQNFARSIADVVSLEMERYQRKQAESKTIKLSRALEYAADAVFITDKNGCIEYVNPAFEVITGYNGATVIGQNSSIISSGKHDTEFYENMWATILGGNEYRDIFINCRSDGVIYYEEKTITPLRDNQGNISSFVSVGKDITERMQTQERLHFLAHHDILTELPNRAMLIERLNHAINHVQSKSLSLAIMFLDLDRFKVINDTLGHNIGDMLLQKVADRLRTCMRRTDTVARIGGDEFVILLEDIEDSPHISAIARNVIETLEQPFDLEEREIFVTSSIGVGVYPQDGEDSNTLLKNADTAMYRAKEQGRNNFQFYSAEMSSSALERLMLETDLRYALSRNELLLYYQPLIELKSGLIIGYEALLRWQHAELGLISPQDFIPLLEEMGLIVSVGEWVLREACLQCMKWGNEGLPILPVSVNLSGRQFSEANLAESITEILNDTGLAPEFLQLEITESVIMQNASTTTKILQALKQLGVELAIDDFGTGYSSLSYLKRFPIDVLKIDRSFVRDITSDPDDASIVSTIITLAHSLNLNVIAEGVETEEQASFLKTRSCDITQGYLYSKPIPADEMRVLLDKPIIRT